MQALSEAHVKRASTNSFDDVVEGNGQGFNVVFAVCLVSVSVVILLILY
jgi:hypothetical protein